MGLDLRSFSIDESTLRTYDTLVTSYPVFNRITQCTYLPRSRYIPVLQSRTVKVNQRRNSINSDHLKAPTT